MSKKTPLDQQHSAIESAHSYGIILDSREIIYHGGVDEEGHLGYTFLNNIRILESRSKEPIIIHQHNIGGDWCSGMIIFDAICQSPCPIIFICHGIAASMGSIIPMACSLRERASVINMPNCDWLIHDGTTAINTGLTYKQSQSWAEWEKRTCDSMMKWYVTACEHGSFYAGKTKAQIRDHIKRKLNSKDDWWLNSREAVEHGFADAVMGDKGYESLEEIREWI